MTTIIAIAARLVPALSLNKKKSGSPIRSATEKQRICRFVRLKATFVLTLDKSLGTGTFTIVDKFIAEIFQTHKKNTLSFMADHKRKGEKLLDKLLVPNQVCS